MQKRSYALKIAAAQKQRQVEEVRNAKDELLREQQARIQEEVLRNEKLAEEARRGNSLSLQSILAYFRSESNEADETRRDQRKASAGKTSRSGESKKKRTRLRGGAREIGATSWSENREERENTRRP